MWWAGILFLAYSALAHGAHALCNPLGHGHLPRVFVLSDISNEPDDTMSFIRLLAHSDLYRIEGMAAVTSVWLNSSTHPDQIHDIVQAYSLVVDNLNAHTNGSFAQPARLQQIITSGPTVYGSAALAHTVPLSLGSQSLIKAVDASNEPLYVQVWGGVNTLAQALLHVQSTRSASQLADFVSRLRVYAISDQDDTAPWIRHNFPQLQYIASIHAYNQYGMATWSGISGDAYYKFQSGGPNSSLVSNEFIAKYFQVGPLGKKYPTPAYIMEGDSPSLLYTIQNGLNSPENPDWGSWGGRYGLVDVSGRSRHFVDTIDTARGVDGHQHASNQATIWRWREAYQYELAARIKWTLSPDYTTAPHPPVVSVNGSCGFEPLHLQVRPGETMYLDASESVDTDGIGVDFDWMHYREPSLTQAGLNEVAPLNFTCTADNCSHVRFQQPAETSACKTKEQLHNSPGSAECQTLHVILSVTSQKEMGLTRYKRIVLQVQR